MINFRRDRGAGLERMIRRGTRVVAAALLLGVVNAGAEAPTGLQPSPASELDPAPSGSFSIIAIPDTQEYLGKGTKLEPQSTAPVTNPEFDTETRWVVDNLKNQKVAFVTQLGDIVDKPKIPAQWELAQKYMSRFDGLVPYGIVVGNHDMAKDGDSSQFQKYFPASHFANDSWYGGTCPGDPNLPNHSCNNANSYQLFSAGGIDFVFLHLECNAPDVVVNWANDVLDKFKDRTALISTHMDIGLADGPPESQKEKIKNHTAAIGRMKWTKSHGDLGNSGVDLWNKLYSKHANLLAIFSADQGGVCAAYRTETGDHGNIVHCFMSDYGTAAVRIYRFLPKENKIKVITYDTASGSLVHTAKYEPDPAKHQYEVPWKPVPMQANRS
jgi:Calcineurin-like phosphoesterase